MREYFSLIADEFLVGRDAVDLAAFEHDAVNMVNELGREVLRHGLERISPQKAFVDDDGTEWFVAKWSHLRCLTLFGPMRVNRPLFRSYRNGPTRCVLSERINLVNEIWTPGAAKLGVRAVSEMPMKRAFELLESAGRPLGSRTSMLRLVGALSEDWESNREEMEATVRAETSGWIPEEARSVAVSLDGVMVLMSDSDKAAKKAETRAQGKLDKGPTGYKEASVGVITVFDGDGNRIQTRRYGRMPESNKVATKNWLRAELEEIRRLRPDLTTVSIADGAANNWTFLTTLETDHEVVDFYHAVEHLQRKYKQAKGSTEEETREKLAELRRDLKEKPHAGAQVFDFALAAGRKAGTASSSDESARRKQPTFAERHVERMAYAVLRENNLPIGSGVTEATCKQLVCSRLRGTGMRLSERGGQAILTFRAHLISDTFDVAWTALVQPKAA